jgi:hypothetical protein
LAWLKCAVPRWLVARGTTIAVCGRQRAGALWKLSGSLVSPVDPLAPDAPDFTIGDYSRNADTRGYGGDDGPRWLPDSSGLLVLVNEDGMVHLHEIVRRDGRTRRLEDGDHATIAFTFDRSYDTIVALTGDDLTGRLFVFAPAATGTGGADERQRGCSTSRLSHPIRFSCPSGGVCAAGAAARFARLGARRPAILMRRRSGSMRASVFCHE